MFKSQTLQAGKDAVILFHGLSSSPLEVQLLGRGLQRAGYTVYMPHLPGYGDGGSDSPRLVTDWQDWVSQALSEFDRVSAMHDHVAVGGLCIGATLALNVAVRRGERVAALISLSLTLWYDGWNLPWYRILLPLAAVFPFGLRYSFKETEPYGVKDKRMRAWIAREMADSQSSMAGSATISAASLIQAQRLCRRTRALLPLITCPVLAIHAVEDEMSSMRNPEYLVRKISASETKLVALRNSYHMITLDQEKDSVLKETHDFLDAHMVAPMKMSDLQDKVVEINKRERGI